MNTSGINVQLNILRKSKLDLSHVIRVTMIRVTISLQVSLETLVTLSEPLLTETSFT